MQQTKAPKQTNTLERRSLHSLSSNSSKELLIDVMSKRQKLVFYILITIWFISLCIFWNWWLQSDHLVTWMGTFFNSLLLGFITLTPGYYFYFVFRMQRPNRRIPVPSDWKVAMVVTKAPSEPWSVVQTTLESMLAQQYPHDTWLADEDPQPETVRWCEAHGVSISTRKGIAEYHRPTWPRRTKCKEGNLAYFYDTLGYENYDFVVQLDADHVPAESYLRNMILPFIDPEVGYVAAPSICDTNVAESWIARARLYAEAPWHGPQQAGYNNGWAPTCIGSHYAIRTVALKEIGGLGPELAEDHTTTLMMNAYGWKGVFAFDAEAHGDGPACFSDFLVQEFQWARSLTQVLLSVTPRYWKGLSAHLKFQFLFCQFWYSILGGSLLFGNLLPVIALLTNQPWAKVDYLEFMFRLFILDLTCLLPFLWIGNQGWLRPQKAKLISWEIVFFYFVRWPWVIIGVLNAIVCSALNTTIEFKVTPKGKDAPKSLPFKALLPYLFLGFVSAVTTIMFQHRSNVQGYHFLALVNSMCYIGLSAAILWRQMHENQNKTQRYLRHKLALLGTFIVLITSISLKIPKTIISTVGLDNIYQSGITDRTSSRDKAPE